MNEESVSCTDGDETTDGREAGSPAKLRNDAERIARSAIDECLPEAAVRRALDGRSFPGRVVLVSVGKAAWRMADAALGLLGDRIARGVVVTKYGHSGGALRDFDIIEAGHPVPDGNSLKGAEASLEAVRNLDERDTVLFLVSGGGSALFECPLPGVSLADLENVTRRLLESGADIREINTIRKRLSSVKAGRFALAARPAHVLTLALSDVLGDRTDTIASGPTAPDGTTSDEAFRILSGYGIVIPESLSGRLSIETPKVLPKSEYVVVGSVRTLCDHAAEKAAELGYRVVVLTTSLNCEAREAARFLASIAREELSADRPAECPCAVIAGGETVVRVTGRGLGGRNQEIALSAACSLDGIRGAVLLSVGSDGSDGPTDAAGGIADWNTAARIRTAGGDPEAFLRDNDSYHALDLAGDLLKTGPTGTNVNDLAIVLCDRSW
jgi:hydroxypyruvate reductase